MSAGEIIRPAFVPGVWTRHELANADYHAIGRVCALVLAISVVALVAERFA